MALVMTSSRELTITRSVRSTEMNELPQWSDLELSQVLNKSVTRLNWWSL